ncbi:uncharacterized protein STEHIDRAFT_115159 [Stereum hirsutum FP-91666 SS1]|uniref:uncharacterized protein n=1 Tax=Stereum hirsutum (strain FP-91666) TaxID=721885 RepID=UPI0004449E58|nr:uncharacterized protein STEHIDRAFT_115159 [Stereum hirsutum FP-91666 SS1]EIM80959.1 hypothetical protein STEHIDRAFT_115159 [Stereum hirsutum FP-91666 SS1]
MAAHLATEPVKCIIPSAIAAGDVNFFGAKSCAGNSQDSFQNIGCNTCLDPPGDFGAVNFSGLGSGNIPSRTDALLRPSLDNNPEMSVSYRVRRPSALPLLLAELEYFSYFRSEELKGEASKHVDFGCASELAKNSIFLYCPSIFSWRVFDVEEKIWATCGCTKSAEKDTKLHVGDNLHVGIASVHVTVINTKGSKTNTRLQKQVSHGVRNTEPRGKAVRENLKGERYEHTEALRSKVYCRQSRQKYNRTAGRGHSGVLEEQAKRS